VTPLALSRHVLSLRIRQGRAPIFAVVSSKLGAAPETLSSKRERKNTFGSGPSATNRLTSAATAGIALTELWSRSSSSVGQFCRLFRIEYTSSSQSRTLAPADIGPVVATCRLLTVSLTCLSIALLVLYSVRNSL